MRDDTLLPVLTMVRLARTELVGGEPDGTARCTELLRAAERRAGDLFPDVSDDAGVLQSVTAARTELRSCLIAADQLIEAGVAATLVAEVLRRGTSVATEALESAVAGPETVGAMP